MYRMVFVACSMVDVRVQNAIYYFSLLSIAYEVNQFHNLYTTRTRRVRV